MSGKLTPISLCIPLLFNRNYASTASKSVGTLIILTFLILPIISCGESKQKVNPDESGWIGTWRTAPQLVEPRNLPPAPGLSGNTLRQVVHVSLGGERLQVHFSNEYGKTPVTMPDVSTCLSL